MPWTPGPRVRTALSWVLLVLAAPARSESLVDELLALPAPPRDWRAEAVERFDRLSEARRNRGGAPADDAPIGALREFWLGGDRLPVEHFMSSIAPGRIRPVLSVTAFLRLLDSGIPGTPHPWARRLPDTPATWRRIEETLETVPRWIADVRRWHARGGKPAAPPTDDGPFDDEPWDPLLAALRDCGVDRERARETVALARSRDPRALPVLREALGVLAWRGPSRTAVGLDDAEAVVLAVVGCGGLSPEEIARCIVTHIAPARLFTTDAARRTRMRRIGSVLRQPRLAEETVAGKLIALANTLEPDDVETIRAIDEALADWAMPSAVRHMARILGTPRATAKTIHHGLLRDPDASRRHAGNLLRSRSKQAGAAGGIASALCGEDERVRSILAGDDGPARLGLLAAARLMRREFPTELVIASLERESEAAARAYLVARDRPGDRRLLWNRYAGEALILGHSSPRFRSVEERLRREILEGRPGDETYALLLRGGWALRANWVVRVRDGRAVATLDGTSAPGRRQNRTVSLSPEELAAFRAGLEACATDSLGPLIIRHLDDAPNYQFLHLTRDGGYRVRMYSPGVAHPWDLPYRRVLACFRSLEDD